MDLLKIVNGGILGSPYIPIKKEFISAAIGAAVGLGSAIFGASKSAQAEKRAREQEQRNHAANNALLNRKRNESYADTASGQNMIRMAKDYADRNWKKAQGASAVGGGTDAATALAKESGNKMVGDTVANMAAQDTARKDSADTQQLAENTRYANQQAQNERVHGANIAQTASSFGNAAGQIANTVGGAINDANVAKQQQIQNVKDSLTFTPTENVQNVAFDQNNNEVNADTFNQQQEALAQQQRQKDVWNMYSTGGL